MAELRPHPFGRLVAHMFHELEQARAIFHLPERRFFLGDAERDFSVGFHGTRASTPLGPAAGPQSQMAQNLVLSWLGGARILELKTVQVDDELVIPRPCIDMQTVGFNVEWSQELKLEQSLEEYVKGAMLIEILVASGELPIDAESAHTIYDMSVGYDLAGIQSERVQAFLHGMRDCTKVVDRLRKELPTEFARFRDLDFKTHLSDTLTLSTFHGCPPDEIERIVMHLLEQHGLHSIVKLNPMLLGPELTRTLLNKVLGYEELHVPDSAFERDTQWDQMLGFVERLGRRADELDLGFGVKFTNTLVVKNHRDFFPAAEQQMYLSGPPLHVLAMHLVRKFRQQFGDRYPISFSAGIDRKNFPDAVALGLVPVTVCSDLLKPGGYGRAKGYFDELASRMDGVGARSIDEYVLRAYGLEREALEHMSPAASELERRACEAALAAGAVARDAVPAELFERWVSAARLANTDAYVAGTTAEPRYRHENNRRVPKKIGSHLELFDCITCDKCIPVCPNDANFTFVLAPGPIPIVKAWQADGVWHTRQEGEILIEEKHQIGNFADFCNDCGNCDVFCPEDGGPYVVKPRFFGSLEDWRTFEHLDGFHASGGVARGRFEGREFTLEEQGDTCEFRGPDFTLELETSAPHRIVRGSAVAEVDLTYAHLLLRVRGAVYSSAALNHATGALPATDTLES